MTTRPHRNHQVPLWFFTAFVIVLLLLLAGCTQSQTQVRSTGNASATSEAHEHGLIVPPQAKRVELHVEVGVDAGAVSWVLTDPHDDVRDEGVVEGSEVTRDLRFEPIVGQWELRVSFDAMTGPYDFRLRARW